MRNQGFRVIKEGLAMRFELGKTYMNTSGSVITIIGAVKSLTYGWCYLAEDEEGNFRPIGYTDDGYAQNWREYGKEGNQHLEEPKKSD